jgi:hypothetical protein
VHRDSFRRQHELDVRLGENPFHNTHQDSRGLAQAAYVDIIMMRVARFVHDIALTIANRPERLAVLPRDQQDPAARCGG